MLNTFMANFAYLFIIYRKYRT